MMVKQLNSTNIGSREITLSFNLSSTKDAYQIALSTTVDAVAPDGGKGDGKRVSWVKLLIGYNKNTISY